MHLVLGDPPNEGKNRKVNCQQGERVRGRIGRSERHVGFYAKKDAGEKCNLLLEKLTGESKQKVGSAQHRQDGQNLECDFLAAKNRLGQPEYIQIADRRTYFLRTAPDLPEASADLPVSKCLV